MTRHKKNYFKHLALALAVSIASTSALANQALIQDGGFETSIVGSAADFSDIAGSMWTKELGSAGIFNPDAVSYTDEATHGNVAYLHQLASISQDLLQPFIDGNSYTQTSWKCVFQWELKTL